MLHSFLRERWKGLRPVLWGTQLKEVELTRAVYAATLNMDANLSGEMPSSPALPAEACGLHPSLFALDTTSDRDCRTPFPTAESTPAKEARSVAPSTGALEGALPPRSPLPSHPDIIVIGAGMAGLIAACTAADAGASVTVIGAGAGALGISSGCVDILGYVNGALFEGKPSDAPALLPAGHPYRIAGAAALRDATAFFLELCREEGYEFIEPGTYFLPTLMGTLKPTALCPASMHPGTLACAKRVCVAAFEGMRDWRPDFIAGQLKCLPAFVGKHFSFASVPSPRAQGRRSLNAPDMARLADSETGLRALTAALRPHAAKTDILLLPPVCGTRPDTGVYRALCDDLGCAVVEMVGMPPGVGGLRLYRLLLHALRKRGATV